MQVYNKIQISIQFIHLHDELVKKRSQDNVVAIVTNNGLEVR